MLKAPISPYVVAGRILSIIGMSFFTAAGILFCIGGFWFWGLGALIGFIPFSRSSWRWSATRPNTD